MKTFSLALITASSLSTLTIAAKADVHALRGSDTMAGVITDAIVQAGLQSQLSYQGGGSGVGEKALVAHEQGIAPMSRPFKTEALTAARAGGVEPIAHVVGLDGVAVFVNHSFSSPGLTFGDLQKIFTCTATKWEDIPASGHTGPIEAYRRNDASGTTDTFKTIVGVTKFGDCVKVVAESDDIANVTSSNPQAVGYAGLSARRDGNQPLALAKNAGDTPELPTVANVRTKAYPLARQLFIYEATGTFSPLGDEARLLSRLLDRGFMDPILLDHDFITLN